MTSHRQDDVADLLAAFGAAIGLDDLIQWVPAVDERLVLARCDEAFEVLDPLRVVVRDRKQYLPAPKQRGDERQDRVPPPVR